MINDLNKLFDALDEHFSVYCQGEYLKAMHSLHKIRGKLVLTMYPTNKGHTCKFYVEEEMLNNIPELIIFIKNKIESGDTLPILTLGKLEIFDPPISIEDALKL